MSVELGRDVIGGLGDDLEVSPVEVVREPGKAVLADLLVVLVEPLELSRRDVREYEGLFVGRGQD